MNRFAATLFLILAFLMPVAAKAQSWPVTIEHRYGTSIVEKEPKRILSLSYAGHDFLLSLGLQPIAIRYWYGDDPSGVWPWAKSRLGPAQPTILRGEINIEQIALLAPDLIIAQWSGLTEADYRILSQIAPTIAPAVGETDFSSPWQLMLERIGRATGKGPEAQTIIRTLSERLQSIRDDHPDWNGKSGVIVMPSHLNAFTSHDIRGHLLADLGLHVPKEVDDRALGRQFSVPIPREDLSPIDADVLIWAGDENTSRILADLPLRRAMRANQEGREVFADEILTAALSHSSPLSLDYALDHLVPLIEAAIDGNPATPVPGADALDLKTP